MSTVRIACDKSPSGYYIQDLDKITDDDFLYKEKTPRIKTRQKSKERNKVLTRGKAIGN